MSAPNGFIMNYNEVIHYLLQKDKQEVNIKSEHELDIELSLIHKENLSC